MKKIFKKNQIIITVLALMIAVAGYINYSDGIKKKSKPVDKEVISNDVEKDIKETETKENESQGVDIIDPGSTAFTSGSTSNFIIGAKLEREQVRASNKEILLEVINNANVSESDKAVATSKMINLTDDSQKEMAAELMLEAKGYINSIVSISEGKADVVVDKEELTDTDIAKIEDIISRKTGISVQNMTITTVTKNN